MDEKVDAPITRSEWVECSGKALPQFWTSRGNRPKSHSMCVLGKFLTSVLELPLREVVDATSISRRTTLDVRRECRVEAILNLRVFKCVP
jgi:hypothetical protein